MRVLEAKEVAESEAAAPVDTRVLARTRAEYACKYTLDNGCSSLTFSNLLCFTHHACTNTPLLASSHKAR